LFPAVVIHGHDGFQDSPARRFPRTVCSAAGVGCTGLFLVLSAIPFAGAGEVMTGFDESNTSGLPTKAGAGLFLSRIPGPGP
jgi:hypothetical protein